MDEYFLLKQLGIEEIGFDEGLKNDQVQKKTLNVYASVIKELVKSQFQDPTIKLDLTKQSVKNLIDLIILIMKHGMKERVNGNLASIWSFVFTNVPKVLESYKDWLISIQQSKTDYTLETLSKSWIIKSLNEKKLFTQLSDVILDYNNIILWYHPFAILYNKENASIFVNLLASLDAAEFAIKEVNKQKNEEIVVVRVRKKKKLKKPKSKLSNLPNIERDSDKEDMNNVTLSPDHELNEGIQEIEYKKDNNEIVDEGEHDNKGEEVKTIEYTNDSIGKEEMKPYEEPLMNNQNDNNENGSLEEEKENIAKTSQIEISYSEDQKDSFEEVDKNIENNSITDSMIETNDQSDNNKTEEISDQRIDQSNDSQVLESKIPEKLNSNILENHESKEDIVELMEIEAQNQRRLLELQQKLSETDLLEEIIENEKSTETVGTNENTQLNEDEPQYNEYEEQIDENKQTDENENNISPEMSKDNIDREEHNYEIHTNEEDEKVDENFIESTQNTDEIDTNNIEINTLDNENPIQSNIDIIDERKDLSHSPDKLIYQKLSDSLQTDSDGTGKSNELNELDISDDDYDFLHKLPEDEESSFFSSQHIENDLHPTPNTLENSPQPSPSSSIDHDELTINSFFLVPNSHDDKTENIPQRNTFVPLKKALYFDIKSKESLESQNFRCKGCDRPISNEGLFKNCRFCHYSGKFYCKYCHVKHKSIIPSYIINKWDFTKKPVCKFYYNFIKEIMDEPLFDINTLNPDLFAKSESMKNVKILKKLLAYEKNYITICKYKDKLIEDCNKILEGRTHLVYEEYFSLKDLYDIHRKSVLRKLNDIHIQWSNHIVACSMCRIRGYHCEICQSQEILFPFQVEITIFCRKCKTLYHKKCFMEKKKCPKCLRIYKRNQVKE